MFRRSIIAFTVVVVAMLALAAPALAGGWAVVTLDSLPREVRAGQSFQLGFVVRQHGVTPTNQDLNGKPLKPVLTARKQGAATSSRGSGTLVMIAARASVQAKGEDTIRVESRQEGAVGHYVADVTFPNDGVWEWQIEVPTYYVQNGANGQEGNAALFAPLTVLSAAAAPAQAPAPTAQPAAAAPVPQPAETTFMGLSPAALRWGGAILLLVAAGVALYTQRGAIGRRVARSQ
ncbi:MAG TPA: hypothetical protein VGJ87_01180 [Roseiflexaceae bacterium]|jgi:hypothetical protein